MFSGRSYDTIRTQFLTTLAGFYTAAGVPLLTAVGSDAWMLGGAVGLLHMGLEHQAEVLQDQILPDRAATEFLNRHGVVDGIDRRAATTAQLTLAITGTALASSTLVGKAFVDAAGARYTPSATSVTLDGAGDGTVLVVAAVGGTAGNQDVGTTLTWVTAPVGFDATAVVDSIEVVAEDEELDPAYATRLIENRQRRPASGSRDDWRDWASDVDGVDEVYVYPLVYGNTTGVLGAVTVLVLGPAQGALVARTRIVAAGTLTNVAQYIEGTHDASGTAIAAAEQVQKRPVTMASDSYAIIAATPYEQHVTMTITPTAGSEFSYTDFGGGGYTISAAVSTTAFTITPAPSGQAVAERPQIGDEIAIEYNTAGANGVRGGYALTTITAIDHGTGVVAVSPELPYTPLVGYDVKPSAPFWSAVMDAVFDVFDGLGPGDTDETPASPLLATRWPTPDIEGRAILHTTRLLSAALDATGVTDATVTIPATATVTPAAFSLIVIGKLTLEE